MGDFSSAMDFIIVLCGVYIIYAAVLMKRTGEIKTSVLLSKNLDLKKCKDLEGYKKFLFPRAMVMGVFTVLFGGAGMLNSYVVKLGAVYFAFLVLLMVILIWYFVDYRRGIRIYWGE